MKPLRHLELLILTMLTGIGIFHSCIKEESIHRMKVETTDLTQIMAITATARGDIIELGYGVEQHGHCWGKNVNPTITGDKSQKGPVAKTGVFSSEITALEAGTVYHLRAYMQSGRDAVYGKDIVFTTADGKASLTTSEVNNITFNSARSGGNIAWVNGDTVQSRGVCWDTLATVNLKIKAGFSTNGSGTGNFTSELTGLTPGKIYFVKAYAITIVDTSYATARGFSTPGGKGAITTIAVSTVTANTAVAGGNITYDGGSSIFERGVCYGTGENPSIAENKTIDGAGMGSFTSFLSGLSPNTMYYLRAYATSSITTIYGEQKSFLSKGIPEITTANLTELTDSTATCGGNVTADWGYPVTERGVCWSIRQNPTTADNRTVDGSDTGSFTSSISELPGLQQGVIYYVRAYATNSVGTGYGEQRTLFVTATVEVINPFTGKTWMDRNLGASKVGSASDYYQWGRGNDGHEKRSSATTVTLSSSDSPGHGLFIIPSSISDGDWRSPRNDNLWQGINGTNNPCPRRFRIPTEAEWMAERNSWSGFNFEGALSPPLRLTASGYRIPRADDSMYGDGGNRGYYWSSTVNGPSARSLYFEHYGSGMLSVSRSYGLAVRCIKE